MTKDILTSLHGHQIGLGNNGELLLRNPRTGKAEVVIDLSGDGVPADDAVKVTDAGAGTVRTVELTLSDAEIPLVDEASVVAYGSLEVFNLPAGLVQVLGAVADLSVERSSEGVNADFDGDFSIGTVPASNNNTLTAAEANIIPSTATPQAVAGVTSARGVSTAAATLDGTSSPAGLYLNFLVDDADHDVTATPASLIVNGTVKLHYIVLGDL